MRKILLVGLVALFAFPSFAMTQVTPTADVDDTESSLCMNISNNLRYRTRDASVNNEVSDLQDFLNMKGYLSSGPTGFFGLATFNAVKKFQSASGFAPTGYVGSLTRAKISALTCGGSVATPTATQTSTPVAIYPQTQTTTTTAISSSLPAGCTSTAGYSQLTGKRCLVPATPAPTPTNLPVGCTSTAGFSSVTGVPCSSSSAEYEEARLKGADAAIKSTLSNIRAIAELYYDSHGNYMGVCNDNSGSNNVSKSKSLLIGYKAEEIVCRDSAEKYAMSARLASPSVGYWCIDSTGASKQTITTLPSGQLSCPGSVTTTTAPSITVLSPNGWESIKIGSSLNFIKWNITTPNPVAGNLEISVVNQNTGAITVLLKACTPLIASSQSDCSNFDPVTNQFVGFNWVVPSNFPIGQYKVYLMVTDRNTGQKLTSDYSDNSFSLIATTTPTITVLSPNGVEKLEVGKTYRVTWSSTAPDPHTFRVHMNLFKSSDTTTGLPRQDTVPIDSVFVSSNGIDWTIPTTVAGGSYLIGLSLFDFSSHSEGVLVAKDLSNAPFNIVAATTATTSPTVEVIGTPTLSLQYDSAGKESMLVGKATAKVTAAGTPIAFGGSVPILLSTNGRQAYTNSTRVFVESSVGVPTVSLSSVIPTIPANTTATISIDINVPTKELFAGSYTLLPTDLWYYLNNTNGANQMVSVLAFKNAKSSNSVTIIGETSPYITSVVSDTASGNISISGTRFYNATANTVTMNGVTKVLPSANAAATLINAVAKDFNITTSGIYPLQISTSEGASNMVNVNVTVATVVVPTTTIAVPTLNPTSLASQYIVGGTQNLGIAQYKFVASNGNATISELKFTVTGTATDAITTVTAGGVPAVVVNGVAHLSGLNIAVPSGSTGSSVSVQASFSAVGVSGVPSNKTATLSLTYMKYSTQDGLAVTNSSINVPSNTMTMVGTTPTVSTNVSTDPLMNGLVKVAEVIISADVAGSLDIVALPINVTSIGTASVTTGQNNIVVKGTDGTTIPTTNSTFVVPAGGTSGNVVVTFTNGYRISAGTSKTFRIYVTATTVPGPANTTALFTKLGDKSLLKWNDVEGGTAGLTGALLIEYPANISTIFASAGTQSTQLAGVLGAFTQTSLPAPIPAPASKLEYEWTRNLEVNSPYANDVSALQMALTKESVFSGEVTGGFYTQTYLGVKAFQAKYGIESTGFVGPQTRAKLNELY